MMTHAHNEKNLAEVLIFLSWVSLLVLPNKRITRVMSDQVPDIQASIFMSSGR